MADRRIYGQVDGTRVLLRGISEGEGPSGESAAVLLRPDGLIDESLLPNVGDNVYLSTLQKLIFSSLASYDKVISLTYTGSGRWKRVSKAVVLSDDFPDAEIEKNIFYYDAETMNQRLWKVEYVGGILPGGGIRKSFQYVLDGIGYRLNSIVFEEIP